MPRRGNPPPADSELTSLAQNRRKKEKAPIRRVTRERQNVPKPPASVFDDEKEDPYDAADKNDDWQKYIPGGASSAHTAPGALRAEQSIKEHKNRREESSLPFTSDEVNSPGDSRRGKRTGGKSPGMAKSKSTLAHSGGKVSRVRKAEDIGDESRVRKSPRTGKGVARSPATASTKETRNKRPNSNAREERAPRSSSLRNDAVDDTKRSKKLTASSYVSRNKSSDNKDGASEPRKSTLIGRDGGGRFKTTPPRDKRGASKRSRAATEKLRMQKAPVVSGLSQSDSDFESSEASASPESPSRKRQKSVMVEPTRKSKRLQNQGKKIDFRRLSGIGRTSPSHSSSRRPQSDSTEGIEEENEVDSVSPTQESADQSPEFKLSIKAIPQRKKGPSAMKKAEYEYRRNRMSRDELSTLRQAFLNHYPVPPSNLQAQSRYEQKYGRQMTPDMVKGLWEFELKPWSDKWWKFYTDFNDFARVKKKEKPEDRDPTITRNEATIWAKDFYESHGDARQTNINLDESHAEEPNARSTNTEQASDECSSKVNIRKDSTTSLKETELQPPDLLSTTSSDGNEISAARVQSEESRAMKNGEIVNGEEVTVKLNGGQERSKTEKKLSEVHADVQIDEIEGVTTNAVE